MLSTFARVAMAGIGGGMPGHTRRAVLARHWLSEQEFAESFTLAQLTPGPNGVNLAAMIGARLGGLAGALAAVLGILTPGLIAMLAVSVLIQVGPGLPPPLQSGLRGAACAALAILMTAALPIVRVGLGVRGGALLCALAFLGIGVLRLELLPVFTVLVGAGLFLHRPRRVPPHD